VGSWLDDVSPEEIEKILTAMTNTRILGNDLNMGIERASQEKKTTKKPNKN
jgi:hypothetical protein